jgi:hypothetical protein
MDGEVKEDIKWPLRCTIRQGALRVLVPVELVASREQ